MVHIKQKKSVRFWVAYFKIDEQMDETLHWNMFANTIFLKTNQKLPLTQIERDYCLKKEHNSQKQDKLGMRQKSVPTQVQ